MAFRLFNRRSSTPDQHRSSDSSPPPDSSLRRETLEERSRRIIGKSLEDDYESKPVAPKEGKKGANKRREQILQAQRAHRQRTQLYMKKLEREVLRLRDAETQARSHSRRVERNNDLLRRTLQANGISIPQFPDVPEPNRLNVPERSSHSRSSSGYLEHDRYSDSSFGFPSPALTQPKTTPEPPLPTGPTVQTTGIVPASYPFIFSPQANTAYHGSGLASFDPNAEYIQTDNLTGVDFVLALESPCLEHLHTNHLETGYHPQDPHRYDENFSNHVFTTSMALLHGSPVQSKPNPHASLIGKSEVDIESLLHASYALDVHEGSVPPVQMWDTVRRVALERGVRKDTLKAIVNDLMPHVHCDGFGAVVDTEIAQAVANKYLS